MYRPKAGILKAKQLKKLKLKEEFKVLTKFIEKNIGKCYKIAARRYFIKNYPINITKVN